MTAAFPDVPRIILAKNLILLGYSLLAVPFKNFIQTESYSVYYFFPPSYLQIWLLSKTLGVGQVGVCLDSPFLFTAEQEPVDVHHLSVSLLMDIQVASRRCILNFLKNCQTFPPRQQCTRTAVLPHPRRHVGWAVFLFQLVEAK